MANKMIAKVPTLQGKITPLGFHRYASEFLRAACRYKTQLRYSPVPYYLCCHALELVLKAFFRAKNIPTSELKKCLGHDLIKTLGKAEELGIRRLISISPQQEAEIRKANKY